MRRIFIIVLAGSSLFLGAATHEEMKETARAACKELRAQSPAWARGNVEPWVQRLWTMRSSTAGQNVAANLSGDELNAAVRRHVDGGVQ